MSELYIGLMSGTSLDGVDGVLIDFEGMRPRVLASASLPMPEGLRSAFLQLNQPGPDELHRSAVTACELADLYALAVEQLLTRSATPRQAVRAIGAHGQTVRHQPPRTGTAMPYTLQLNQPARLAERTGISVVADFRSRDVAAGGQGAPLVPSFHRHAFGQAHSSVAVVNIGGIANVTALPAQGHIQGLDTGPGNALLDEWCERHTGQRYDAEGAWGATGECHPALLRTLLDDPYFSAGGIKSTGRDHFNLNWLQQRLQGYPDLRPQDVQATLTTFTAATIALGLKPLDWGGQPPAELLVCGGGAFNQGLMAALAQQLPGVAVRRSDEAGWPAMLVEAAAFAWLARQCVLGLPGNEPSVTGAQGARVLGAVYPA